MDPLRFWRIISESTINFAGACRIHYLFLAIIMNSSSVTQIQNESIISFREFTTTSLSVTRIHNKFMTFSWIHYEVTISCSNLSANLFWFDLFWINYELTIFIGQLIYNRSLGFTMNSLCISQFQYEIVISDKN